MLVADLMGAASTRNREGPDSVCGICVTFTLRTPSLVPVLSRLAFGTAVPCLLLAVPLACTVIFGKMSICFCEGIADAITQMPSGLVGDPSRKRLALPRNYLSQGLEVRGCKGLPLGPDRIRRSCLRTTTARTTQQVERIREENKATLTLTLLNTNEALRVHCPSDLFWRVLEKPIDHSKEDREKKTCVYLSHRFGLDLRHGGVRGR